MQHRVPSTTDFLLEAGARRLAANIVEYWVKQGYPPAAIDIRTERERTDVVVVRSNLRNGSPPGRPISEASQ